MKPDRKSWIVKLRCVVEKEVVTTQCTEDEATSDPFGHSEDEIELSQLDWTVESVKPNE